ncbi:MAG: ABC transporter permease [Bacteroidetes bacterium]|nr:MAG: ABC transporter permease [Bacteroidota bacterium]
MLLKELQLEWKQKYAFNGLLLYVVSMVVVISLAFVDQLNPLSWNILYWLIMLFVAINAVAKSFMSESPGQLLYLYSLARPAAVILAKIVYNSLLLMLVGFLAWLVYAGLSETEMARPALFALLICLGSFAFSANLTLVSAIAARAENKTTLLAVLSFPLIVPILLTLIKASRFAIEELDVALGADNLRLLAGISVVLTLVSLILFPLIWRE